MRSRAIERRRAAGRATWLTVLAMLLVLALAAPACTGGDDESGSPDDDGGEVVGSGDRYEATIRRTTDGVAHIQGQEMTDVAFGQGYASGQDRTCDLIDQVIKVRGERARYLGAGDDDANLNSDVAWRAIGTYEQAEQDWSEFPENGVAVVTAFAEGWNANLDETGVDGVAGWCRGADWVRPVEPVEIYAYARSVALLASSGQVARFIPTAQPPAVAAPAAEGAALRTPTVPGPTAAESGERPTLASNGWAVGSERAAGGGGLLVGNPHFPWDGELRFWESHLTVPGEVDIYGAQLSGLPGIGVGFTKDVGWTYTVSAGNRFTAYRLDLVPGSPTKYRYGDEVRDITPSEHTIQVLGADGSVSDVVKTTWSSHYGPILDFPGMGWSDSSVITYRDANIDNDEFLEQHLETMKVTSLDDLQSLHEEYQGVPLFNTIAASSDGRAWYADTAATPNLSDEAIAAYEESLSTDSAVKLASESRAVLLDGSDPMFEWVDEPGARDPGLVPYADQPQTERGDYVFNANDSFWLPNATHVLAGDYSPLHGPQDTSRSPRTRENAVVLDDTTPEGPSGRDGKFTLDEIADAALLNQGFTARELRAAVVERCRAASGPVQVPEVPAAEDGGTPLPAATVDVAPACAVLADWDGRYDLDSTGAALWREFLARYDQKALMESGALWAEPFDAERPVETPSGLAPAAPGSADSVVVNLATAVEVLRSAGYAPDVALGDIQFAPRDGERIPMHGGNGADGVTNIVTYAKSATSRDPALLDTEQEKLLKGSTLSRVAGETGYPVNYGTSFLFAVEFGDGEPTAKAFLTYGNPEDRSSDLYTAATERFSQKNWRDVAFTETAIEADQVGPSLTVRG